MSVFCGGPRRTPAKFSWWGVGAYEEVTSFDVLLLLLNAYFCT